MKRNKADARDLLQKASDQPLSEVETLRLQAYEATDEGQAYRDVHTLLHNEMPHGLPQFRLNRHKLKGITAQVEGRVQRKRRMQRLVSTTRTIALATAVILIAFFAYNWITIREFIPEPAAPAAAITRPTTITALGPGMKYAHLETAVPELLQQLPPVQYAHTLPETAEKARFNLLIPSQLDADLTFVGSLVNDKQHTAEIVLRSASKVAGWHRLWFLIQSPLGSDPQNQSLPLAYQLPWNMENTNMKTVNPEIIEVLGTEGIYEGYDLSYSDMKHYNMSEHMYVRTLSWQTDDQQMTLTIFSPNPISADKMKQVIESWQLTPYNP